MRENAMPTATEGKNHAHPVARRVQNAIAESHAALHAGW
jgi:hypothetical protein